MEYDLSTKDDFDAATKRIKLAYRRLCGRTQGGEDCAQEIITKWLDGQGVHQTIDQAVIDYLRRGSGRKGNASYTLRQNLNNACDIESNASFDFGGGSAGLSVEDRFDVIQFIEFFRGWERAVMYLTFVEGYGQSQIGHFFGVTEARVSQWITGFQKRISARIKEQERRTNQIIEEEKLFKKKEPNKRSVPTGTDKEMETTKSWEMASYPDTSF